MAGGHTAAMLAVTLGSPPPPPREPTIVGVVPVTLGHVLALEPSLAALVPVTLGHVLALEPSLGALVPVTFGHVLALELSLPVTLSQVLASLSCCGAPDIRNRDKLH